MERERRADTKYYVLSEEQIKRFAAEAANAGGKAAVDDLIAVIGRNVIKKSVLAIGTCLAAVSAWLSGLVHFGPKP